MDKKQSEKKKYWRDNQKRVSSNPYQIRCRRRRRPPPPPPPTWSSQHGLNDDVNKLEEEGKGERNFSKQSCDDDASVQSPHIISLLFRRMTHTHTHKRLHSNSARSPPLPLPIDRGDARHTKG